MNKFGPFTIQDFFVKADNPLLSLSGGVNELYVTIRKNTNLISMGRVGATTPLPISYCLFEEVLVNYMTHCLYPIKKDFRIVLFLVNKWIIL